MITLTLGIALAGTTLKAEDLRHVLEDGCSVSSWSALLGRHTWGTCKVRAVIPSSCLVACGHEWFQLAPGATGALLDGAPLGTLDRVRPGMEMHYWSTVDDSFTPGARFFTTSTGRPSTRWTANDPAWILRDGEGRSRSDLSPSGTTTFGVGWTAAIVSVMLPDAEHEAEGDVVRASGLIAMPAMDPTGPWMSVELRGGHVTRTVLTSVLTDCFDRMSAEATRAFGSPYLRVREEINRMMSWTC